jgi:membrane protease YdiL (CAAX protease family)
MTPPTPTPTPPLPTYARVFASLDALFSIVLSIFFGGATKALVIRFNSQDLIGFSQSLAPIVVFCLVYSSRFGSFRNILIGIGHSLIPSRLFFPRLFVIHVVQLIVLLISWPQYLTLSSISQIISCGSTTSILWAPLFEEIAFRLVAFYIALQRSGGDVTFAAINSACLFGAIHIANVYATGATSLYAWMQVAQAAIVGFTWTLMFAKNGCLFDTIVLHSINNFIAIVYLSQQVSSGVSKNCTEAISSTSISYTLVASLLCQVFAYSLEAVFSWSFLEKLAIEKNGIVLLRKLHPIMYQSKPLLSTRQKTN